MYRPKRTRKDKNHKKIVEKCRERGIVIWDTSDLGGKVLDIVAFYNGKIIPIEIKSRGNKDNLTSGERAGIDELQSVGIYPIIATTAEDIFEAFEERNKERL